MRYVAFLLAVSTLACSPSAPPTTPAPETPAPAAHSDAHDDGDDHGHHHTAPHGGALVMLGDHTGHLELVLDPATGTLTAYALDGHAEHPVRMQDPALIVEVSLESGPAVEVILEPVASPLTGETAGDTSQFAGANPLLQGKERFKGIVRNLTFRGQPMGDVPFTYPEGNE